MKATVNRELQCLKVLFRKAVEWGLFDESPARNLKKKEVPNPPRLLESAEIARLIDEMPSHLSALVSCAVYAGLRRDHPTKNRETRRIPICETLREALDRHPRWLGCPYVFANSRGHIYNDVRKPLNKAALRAGIEGRVNLHQLAPRLLLSRPDERK